MNQKEYEQLQDIENAPAVISVDMLSAGREGKEGTLLWGYTCERESFHVYLKDGKLHRIIYRTSERKILSYESGTVLEASMLHPSKRIYPEATSFDFARALIEAGEQPSMTRFDEDRPPADWYGMTYEELCDTELEKRRPQ